MSRRFSELIPVRALLCERLPTIFGDSKNRAELAITAICQYGRPSCWSRPTRPAESAGIRCLGVCRSKQRHSAVGSVVLQLVMKYNRLAVWPVDRCNAANTESDAPALLERSSAVRDR